MEAVKKFTGLASDSREVKPGYLFAAIAGYKGDGAAFVKDAVARGAMAVLGTPEIGASVAEPACASSPTKIRGWRWRAMPPRFTARSPKPSPPSPAPTARPRSRSSCARSGRRWASAPPAWAPSAWSRPSARSSSTTPRPVPIEIHRICSPQLKRDGVEHLAVEASSHGLDQFRLDGVEIAAVGFTNITRDHMDYHPTFEAYLACKLRLFAELVRDGGVAVVNADTEHADAFIAAAAEARAEAHHRRRKGRAA